ncbi:MAG: DinB family protein [Armatimonadetes bacterium]|nr:DinB family protein [Armatimonadota bacterium]MDW8154760.1 DinB family protein [Armatimonadota bacterium]
MGIHPADAYEYLVKARGRLLEWVGGLSQEQYTQEFPFGLRSIRATLVHTASAEWGYVRRLLGEPVPPPQERPFAPHAQGTFPPFAEAWARQAEETRRVLRSMEDWNRPAEYVIPLGGRPRRYRTTAAGIATQLLFHEVHHRAQVMAMLRQLGIPAENLDYSVLMFEPVEE